MAYAPGWQIRCTRCGTSRDASEAGLTRIAWTLGAWTIGWCRTCKRLRLIQIERKSKAGHRL